MLTASSTSSLNGMSFFRHVQLLLPMPRLRFHLILSGLEVLKLLTSATSVRLVHCNRAQKMNLLGAASRKGALDA